MTEDYVSIVLLIAAVNVVFWVFIVGGGRF